MPICSRTKGYILYLTSTMVWLSGSYRYAAELYVSPRPPIGLQEAPIDTPRDPPLPSKKHEYNRGYSKGYIPENRDTTESAVGQILNTRDSIFLFHCSLISHLIVKSYYIICNYFVDKKSNQSKIWNSAALIPDTIYFLL